MTASRRAFSLLELLVAVALLVVLAGAVSAFIFTLFDREQRALSLAQRTHAAALLLDRLEQDLITAVAAGPEGPGFVGNEHTMTIHHRAVLAAGPHAPDGDLQKTVIRFDPDTRSLTLERLAAEARPQGSGAASPAARGEAFATDPDAVDPLSAPVAALRLRYHDGRAWRSSFSSDNRLPAAVELAIWFGPTVAQTPGTEDATAPEGLAPLDDDFGTGLPSDQLDRLLPDFDEPDALPTSPPDRVRIIAIPDAAEPAAAQTPDASPFASRGIGGRP